MRGRRRGGSPRGPSSRIAGWGLTGHPAGQPPSVPSGQESQDEAAEAVPRSAGHPGHTCKTGPVAEAEAGAVLWAGPRLEPAEQHKRVADSGVTQGRDRAGSTQTPQPWPLLTVTWKGLLGTCSPPKRTQMTYLPGWGAV